MLYFQDTRGEGVLSYASQEADFAAVCLSGEVRKEDKADGERPVVHGVIHGSEGRWMVIGRSIAHAVTRFRPW